MYYHGESLNVNVVVTNNSNKTLRKIRISGKLMNISLKTERPLEIVIFELKFL